MTDSRGPPQRGLCFLSTLLSQKVPEKSDTVLRCMISGQPKPEVTWYKNGQTIEECGIISSYEFFQNQYIHMLHLYCCTQDDAAVYQISAKNGQGMICCSASLEVERSTTLPDPGAPETRPVDREKAPPNEAQARTSWAAPGSADPPSSQSHGLAWGQLLANGDLSASSTDHPRCVEATRQTEEVVHGQLRPESSPASAAQDGHRSPGSVPRPISGVQEEEALSHAGPSHAAFSSAPQNPRAEKYISFSLPLPPPPLVTAESGTLGQPAACPEHPSPRLPSEDSDSDYELCPEITFTYTEEFSDDDLEYLECSDVMTDYSNAIWQRSLQGAERVFLLESDDEEPEFSERGLEGCEPLGSDTGGGPGVSGDTAPMDSTPDDVCGHHSRPREVGVRSHPASPHRPSSPMTLARGPHQAGMSTVADQRGYKRPVASGATGNDYPGIPGDTRAGEEFGSDKLLNMEEAGAGTESREPETAAGRDQGVEPIGTQGRAGEKGPLGKRNSEKPSRGKRLATAKGKVKKLKGSVPRAPPDQLLGPTGPAQRPLNQAGSSEGPRALAEAALPDTQAAGEGASRSPVQPEGLPLQTQPWCPLPQDARVDSGEQACSQHLPETSCAPEGNDRPQAETQAPCWKTDSLGPAPAGPDRVGEEEEPAGSTRTRTGSVPSGQGPSEEHVPGAPLLEAKDRAGDTRLRESSDSRHPAPTAAGKDLGPAPRVPKTDDGPTLTATSVHPEGRRELGASSAEPPEPPEAPDAAPALVMAYPGPAGGEAACPEERFRANSQGAGHSPDAPSGDPVDGHIPPKVSPLDLELDKGQDQVPGAFDPSNKGPGVPSQDDQGIDESPDAPTGDPVEGHVTLEVSPLDLELVEGQDQVPEAFNPSDEGPGIPSRDDQGIDESPEASTGDLVDGHLIPEVSPLDLELVEGQDQVPEAFDPSDEGPRVPSQDDQGIDESPVTPTGDSVDGHLTLEVSPLDLELVEGQDQVPEAFDPSDEGPSVPSQDDQGIDESPVTPTGDSVDGHLTLEVSPLDLELVEGQDQVPEAFDPSDEGPSIPSQDDQGIDESPVTPTGDPMDGHLTPEVSPLDLELAEGQDQVPGAFDPSNEGPGVPSQDDQGIDESPDTPTGDPMDGHLTLEVSFLDLELAEGQDQVPGDFDPSYKGLGVPSRDDQGIDESPDAPTGDPVDGHLTLEVSPLDLGLVEGQDQVPGAFDPSDEGPGVPSRAVAAAPPPTSPQSGQDPREDVHPISPDPACSLGFPLAQEDAAGETVPQGPSHSISAGLGQGCPHAPEDSSPGPLPEAGDEGPGAPAGESPGETCPQETMAPPRTSLDGLRVAGDTLVTVTPGHPTELFPDAVTGCSQADSPQGCSPQTLGQDSPQLPPGPALDTLPTEALEEGLCLVPAGPDVPMLVSGSPEGAGSGSDPPLEIGNKLQAEGGVDSRGLQWRPLEQGGALAPSEPVGSTGPPPPGDDVQARLTPVAPEGAAAPQHCPAQPEPAGVLSPLASLSQALLGAWEGGPAGPWGAGRKLKIITLEAPLPDSRTLGLPDADFGASGKDPSTADKVPVRTARGVSIPPGTPEDSGACGPLSGVVSISASAAPGGQQPPTQHTSPTGLLESSVDPTDESELCDAGGRPEAPQTGEKVDAGLGGAEPETPRSPGTGPGFLQRLLTRAGLLKPSVDPLEETPESPASRVGGLEGVGSPGTGEDSPRGGLPGQCPLLQPPGTREGGEVTPQGNQSPAGRMMGAADRHHAQDQAPRVPESGAAQPRDPQPAASGPAGRGTLENKRGAGGPSSPAPDGPASPPPHDRASGAPLVGGVPAACASLSPPSPVGAQAPATRRARDPALGGRTRTRDAGEPEVVRKKRPDPAGSGHLAEGMKKKILSRVAAVRLRLEEKENDGRRGAAPPRKGPVPDRKEARRRGGKAPVLLKKIQAELLPDHPGNLQLSCQFAEIHEDSTIRWTKDSESIAQVQRRAGDNSTVSLAIVQASPKDQGLYYCCLNNSFGKATAEFNLTAQVLQELSSCPDVKRCEEIEFSQLLFREDFLRDSYFGAHVRGRIATEARHFGEGVHRKAFRSRVLHGLPPVFQPGHACVLKVHNAVAYGTRSNDELVQRNYKLAAQECYVQNTARHYAQIYAAEAQPLEGFGEVPEIIPIFLIHRPENNIPYATVEEELIGEFVKYSMRDGKEINFLRRDSEAGQKCCTFQHWVYQKTGGCLLVTDMQGVGMKLTDVGIATLAKGYKGFKGNCSMSFIDQFKALHQCNKYCKMLGLKSLQSHSQKQKKPSCGVGKAEAASRKPAPGSPAEKKP